MVTRGLRGVHDAFTWLTVAPLPQPRGEFDRRRGGTVIAAVPMVGLALGALAGLIAFGLAHTGLPAMLIGAMIVAGLALATRGMHLDGLADTVDGLGSYGDPERVREIMRTGDVGPFGAATLALVVLAQAAAFGTLTSDADWFQIALIVFVSRAAVPLVCRRGLTAANADGFGALVAGSQGLSVAFWTAVAVGAALAISVQAAVTVAVVLAFGWVFSRHCARRTGGITGDVIGATIEVTATLTAVGLLI